MKPVRPSEHQSILIKQHYEFIVDGSKIISTKTYTSNYPNHKMSGPESWNWMSILWGLMSENQNEWLDEMFAQIVAEV